MVKLSNEEIQSPLKQIFSISRFGPGKDWVVNENLDEALDILKPVKNKFGESLSWADLIILASNIAVEVTSEADDEVKLPFCPGRVDDTRGSAWSDLEPRIVGHFNETLTTLKDYIQVMGLSQRHFAALVGLFHSKSCQLIF